MGERRHQQQQQQWRRHHPALDEVVNLLSKANRDLYALHHHLDKEFERTYPDHVRPLCEKPPSGRWWCQCFCLKARVLANPYKLVYRIKKIQQDLASLKEMCRELLAEKQDVMDKARATLVGQRSSLQRLLASSGLPLISDDDESAYTNLNQIIDEWSAQMRAKTGEVHDHQSEDINQMLFSSIVQDG